MSDLDGIERIEAATFGRIDPNAAASPATLRRRICLLNADDPAWFLVAVAGADIVGTMVLQPTDLAPEECTSWEAATDNGTLARSFKPDGRNLYGVSLAVPPAAPPGTAELLIHAACIRWIAGRKHFIFCSRMPGFAATNRKTGISPEDYVKLRRRNGAPRDPLLFLYWRWLGGVYPVRLLRDGYVVDRPSGGHAALFAPTDARAALLAIAPLIYEGGVAMGLRA
ncbi:MAG TPA: hypothetical protein VF173_06280 [Thermoanaerobaculia bacterium]|nr:hypothetical protein [Thermoanaerobaculia bacterium]